MEATKKRKILAIRHGESVWNVLHKQHRNEHERYHPRMCMVDCDITERGKQQARRAGELLASEVSGIDLLMISPLRRALQTASIIAAGLSSRPRRALISKDATEVMLDPCDIGSSPQALAKEFPKYDFSHLEENWWHGGLTSEETLSQMKESRGLEEGYDTQVRIERLKLFLREKEDKDIVIICHSDIIWWLTRRERNGQYFGQQVENGEIVDITSFIQPANDST